jgi:peptidoglycan hydrolase CwlO-like protein
MSKIEKKTIEEKKQSLRGDIEKLEKSLTELGEQQKQLQANLYALHGALQQCDQFLELLQEEKENVKNG